MQIHGRTVLILGGSGLVGTAVARQLLEHEPDILVLSSLLREDAESAVSEIAGDTRRRHGTKVVAEWGDIFVAEELKQHPRGELIADPASRALLLDDLFGELTSEVVKRSALGALLLRHKPDIIIDCVNTATAIAYQNIYDSALQLRANALQHGSVSTEEVEKHLATLYLPQLIRHVQIALEAMRRVKTECYIKIGTAGTGGMGLNVPFTHSEERPSRMLLAKAGVAGAHTLLLYLMARTPGAPAVKEIKPTAAISWKRIAFGEVLRRGRPIECYDATRALPLTEAFSPNRASPAFKPAGTTLKGVFVDSGENGLFSLPEFETLTALGLMEYITPEEIADNVVRELSGHPSGKDIVAALDGATSGPTYRAGVLRQVAIDEMQTLEREHGVNAVAYEMLGPPRLSKLLFEGALLGRLFSDLGDVAELDAKGTAERMESLIEEDGDLRMRILSIGLPVLLPDGEHMLRGPEIKVAPEHGMNPEDPRLADNGWVDLRPANWERWRKRARAILSERERSPGPELGSRSDVTAADGRTLRPGALAAWIFRNEDAGLRIKR
jgi:NAD(P)-dependent dehydrogenase (short-subunit alcohol dehydrogenase family)